jgi:hypothetical protein
MRARCGALALDFISVEVSVELRYLLRMMY